MIIVANVVKGGRHTSHPQSTLYRV